MKWILILMLSLAGECLASDYVTASGYLGIPDQATYPDTNTEPITEVRDRYWQISTVKDAPYGEYAGAVSNGTAMFVAPQGDIIYFCTEMSGDFEQSAGVWAWVTILYRWKTKIGPEQSGPAYPPQGVGSADP